MGNKRVRLIISGIVQGVFFRSASRHQALSLGIKGWVKNRVDGTVEVVAEGAEDAVAEFMQWCHEGPVGARVDEVNFTWEEYEGEFTTFAIKYSDYW
jgi:acylphosphatase